MRIRHRPTARTRHGRLREFRSLGHLFAPYRREAVVWLGATVVLDLLWLLPPFLSKLLIDDGLADDDRGVVVAVAAASLALAFSTLALTSLTAYYSHDIAARMGAALQRAGFRHVLALPMRYHDDHPVGHTLSRLTNDVSATRRLVSSSLPEMIGNAVGIAGSVAFMVALDLRLAVVTLVIVVPTLYAVTRIYRRVVTPLFLAMRDTIGAVTDDANRSLGAIDLIQAYNQERRHLATFVAASRANGGAEYRTVRVGAFYLPTTSLLSTSAMGVLVMLGGVQVVRGNAQIGTVVAFFGYLQSFLAPLVNLSSTVSDYESGVAALDKVVAVLDEPVPASGGAGARPGTRAGPPPGGGEGAMRLEHVSVAGAGGPLVRDVELSVPARSVVAFVGDAASGRDALGRVLAGVTAPSGGVVRLDGEDLATLDPASRTAAIGYVSPETRLLAGTVRDNLLLGAPSADDDALRERLGRIFGPGLVPSLAEGLDTPVGRDGRALPTGARQAIVIARALLRAPSVLVIDGATDALDAETLRHMIAAREAAPIRHTVVATTSQPLIADYADVVVVLRDGRIAEQGTPADLLARGGLYAGLHARWRGGLSSSPAGAP